MTIFQNSLLLAIGFGLSNITLASSCTEPFAGYYANLSLGAKQNAATISATDHASFFRLNTGSGNHLDSFQEVRVWKNAFIGALSFGYGGFFANDWHLSGEVFVNFAKRHDISLDNSVHSQAPLDSELLSTDTKAKLHNVEFGVDLLPGFLFDSQSVVYGRIGLAINKLTIDSSSLFSFTDFAIVPGATDNSIVTMSDAPNKVGLRLGLGIEHEIASKLAVTADYIYTYYGRANTHGIADLIALPEVPIAHITNGLSGNASVRLQTQMLMLGVKYYF